MKWISGLSRRVKIAAAIVVGLSAIGMAQSEEQGTRIAATAEVVEDPVADVRPRATTTERRFVTTTELTTTSVPPTTTTITQVPPTTRPFVAPARYVAPTTPPTSPTAPSGAGCHPSYDPCIADTGGDVDCAGGSGNGPRYVEGPVTVRGDDEYDLDHDDNGVGCES